jgi:hypothetical protein
MDLKYLIYIEIFYCLKLRVITIIFINYKIMINYLKKAYAISL